MRDEAALMFLYLACSERPLGKGSLNGLKLTTGTPIYCLQMFLAGSLSESRTCQSDCR